MRAVHDAMSTNDCDEEWLPSGEEVQSQDSQVILEKYMLEFGAGIVRASDCRGGRKSKKIVAQGCLAAPHSR
jgi:hypothetical protein